MAESGIRVHIYGDYDNKDINKAIKDLETLRIAGQTTTQRLQAFGDDMKSMGQDISNVGKKLSLSVTLPLVGIGVAAVATQGEFETTMNSLQVNAQATGKQMEALSGLAIQLGKDTVYSANEAAGAMLELSKGGLKPAEIQAGALKSALNLAATEGLDLSQAATIVVQSMNTFGIKAKDTGKVVDLLAAGAVASTAGVEDLSAGMKYVGSTAAALKVPMDDTVTALAALNNAGLDSSTAGTSLNRFLMGLIPTTSKSAKMMDSLGLSFTNAKGEILPMDKVIGRLRESVAGLGDDQRQAALKAMFGVEGMRAANILLAGNVDGYNSLRDAVTQQGVAQQMADARMKGTQGTLEQLKGSIETALLAIGTALAPVITTVADFIKQLVDKFTSLDPAIQSTIVVVGILAAALGPVLIIVGSLISAMGAIIGVIGAVSAPVLAVIAAIGAFVAILVLLWAKSEAFRNGVMAIWNTVKAAIQGAVDNIKAKLNENKDTIQTLVNAFQKFWSFIQQYVIPIITLLVQTYLQQMITMIGNVIGWIIQIVGWIVKWYEALFLGGQKIVAFVQSGLQWFGTLVSGIRDKFNSIVSFVKELPGRIASAASGMWDSIVSGFKNMVNTIIGGWNRLSFSLPSADLGPLGKVGGWTLSTPDIPYLAQGGIVTQPTLALIGEAGPEAVMPLTGPFSPLGAQGTGGNTYNITVQAGVGDPRQIGQQVVEYIRKFEQTNGAAWRAA